MAELINLRQARKRAEREKKDEAAEENRRMHGRPKASRQREEAEKAKAARDLDAHRIVREDGE